MVSHLGHNPLATGWASPQWVIKQLSDLANHSTGYVARTSDRCVRYFCVPPSGGWFQGTPASKILIFVGRPILDSQPRMAKGGTSRKARALLKPACRSRTSFPSTPRCELRPKGSCRVGVGWVWAGCGGWGWGWAGWVWVGVGGCG